MCFCIHFHRLHYIEKGILAIVSSRLPIKDQISLIKLIFPDNSLCFNFYLRISTVPIVQVRIFMGLQQEEFILIKNLFVHDPIVFNLNVEYKGEDLLDFHFRVKLSH